MAKAKQIDDVDAAAAAGRFQDFSQMSPTELLEAAAEEYKARGGQAGMYVDVHPQGQYSQSTGARVFRLPWENFDEEQIQAEIRKAAGPGVYVLTLRAPGTSGHIARVTGFRITGDAPNTVQSSPATHTAAPAAAAGPSFQDFMLLMQNQQNALMGIFKAALESKAAPAAASPSLLELMALLPKPATLLDQVQVMSSLQGLAAKAAKGLPMTTGDDDDDGDGDGGPVMRGIVALLERIGNSKSAPPRQAPPPAAAKPAGAPGVPPPPATPHPLERAPRTAEDSERARLDDPPPPPATAADMAAALAWGSVLQILKGCRGSDTADTAAALAPFLDACVFKTEIGGVPMAIQAWDAIDTEAGRGKVVAHIVESAPQELTGQEGWLHSVIDQLLALDAEEEAE